MGALYTMYRYHHAALTPSRALLCVLALAAILGLLVQGGGVRNALKKKAHVRIRT